MIRIVFFIAMQSTIILGLLQSGAPLQGMLADGKELLVGSVVRYDALANGGTSQGDLLIKTELDARFIRLRYSPHDFGFDAPPSKESELLPKEMFSNGSLLWNFRVHVPNNYSEIGACKSIPKKAVRDKDGHLAMIEGYVPVPGREAIQLPRTESLPCLIVDSWSKRVSTPTQ